MLIENFVGFIIKKKNDSYLRFDPKASCYLPTLEDRSKALMMYIHIPFCEELCTYCSFHRVEFTKKLAEEYFAALREEIMMHKELGHKFEAVYIGGGTPTVLMTELVRSIELLKSLFKIKEISVETNPNHLDEEHMGPLRDVGVNRLSVGVQSFDAKILKATGRYHKYGSGEEICAKIEEFRDYFPTFNVDMMFNFPIQEEKSLRNDLETIKHLKVSQVTYYPLMVSKRTKRTIKETMGSFNNKRGRKFYELICDTLGDKYRPATAWCFNRADRSEESAKLVDEYVINYDDYVGVGSGSIGYLEGCIYANTFSIPEYIKRVNGKKFPISARRDCSKKERLLYHLLMELFGLSLDLDVVSKKRGVSACLWLFPEILFFRLIGGIEKKGNHIKVKDRYYWVIMMREFFTSVNNFREYCREKTDV